jgi:hypothetical protein
MKVSGRNASLFLLLIAVVGLVAASRKDDSGKSWEPPKFCRGMDCPRFEVLQTLGGLELRRYEPGNWITTNVTGKPWSGAIREGYRTLDDYRGGNNKNKTRVAETVPYFTLFYPAGEKDREVKSYYTIEYFVPYALQEEPPVPATETVNWVHVNEQEVWVQTFGGYAKEPDIVDRAFNLYEQLRQEGYELEEEYFGFAQYDPVTTVINRHNEVWIFIKGEEPSPSTTSHRRGMDG